MVLASLKETIGLLLHKPVLWINGLAVGILSALELLLSLGDAGFYAERVWILEVLVMPFLVGGTLGMIRDHEFALSAWLRNGRKYYFNVLLPSLLIFFAAILTVFLAVITLTVLGIGPSLDIISFVAFGVIVPLVYFTFFYDAVAVFEQQKVFESLRRSVEFVISGGFRTFGFFIVLIALFFVIGIAALALWSGLLAGQLEPLTQMSPDQLETLMPEDITALIDTTGIWISAGIYAAALALYVTILYPFKAVFYRNSVQPAADPQGEYDEKGRWFKYT
ncbi:MAG: hypothetical protein QCH35_09095 [Methanomicrobiaceae archaeon]|nr:hypothetical protein [Methanomicrobiaceae archaeon]